MTDNDIIKALEHCRIGKRENDCKKCLLYGRVPACVGYLAQNALALINRQKAEIEQWKEEANKHQNLWCEAVMDVQTAKAEAIKEFAERLKAKRGTRGELWDSQIDNLVKEMTEEHE